MSAVRLNPKIQYVKDTKEFSDDVWKDAKEVSSWFVYDATGYDPDGPCEENDKPGVCVAFDIGNKHVSMTIALEDLILAAADIVERKVAE